MAKSIVDSLRKKLQSTRLQEGKDENSLFTYLSTYSALTLLRTYLVLCTICEAFCYPHCSPQHALQSLLCYHRPCMGSCARRGAQPLFTPPLWAWSCFARESGRVMLPSPSEDSKGNAMQPREKGVFLRRDDKSQTTTFNFRYCHMLWRGSEAFICGEFSTFQLCNFF